MTTSTPATGRSTFLRGRLDEPAVTGGRSRRNRLLFSTVSILVSVVLFTRVWDWWTEREDLSRWDVPLMSWLMDHRNPVLTGVLEAITTITAPAGMIVISALTVLVWLLRSKHWWRPLLLAGAMAVAVACIVGIKSVAARGRPPVADMLMGADTSYSFPSGRTLATATFVLVLLYLAYFRPRIVEAAAPLPERAGGASVGTAAPSSLEVATGTTTPRPSRSPLTRWWVAAAGVALIGVVAFSRLYLGYHWLTDVTASLLLAIAILGLVVGVDAWRPTARRAELTRA